jgi:hypothetical protein
MHGIFYNSADIIVMSSGTWIDYNKTMIEMGIPIEKAGIVKMYSEFPAVRRPVIVRLEEHDMFNLSALQF